MKSRFQRITGMAAAVALILPLSGCFIVAPLAAGVITIAKSLTLAVPGDHDDSFDNWVEYWAQDYRYTLRAWNKDVDQLHKSIDRHFLDYNWDDPYL